MFDTQSWHGPSLARGLEVVPEDSTKKERKREKSPKCARVYIQRKKREKKNLQPHKKEFQEAGKKREKEVCEIQGLLEYFGIHDFFRHPVFDWVSPDLRSRAIKASPHSSSAKQIGLKLNGVRTQIRWGDGGRRGSKGGWHSQPPLSTPNQYCQCACA